MLEDISLPVACACFASLHTGLHRRIKMESTLYWVIGFIYSVGLPYDMLSADGF